MVDAAVSGSAGMDCSVLTGDVVVLTRTGRVRVVPDVVDAELDTRLDSAHVIGAVKWSGGKSPELAARAAMENEREIAALRELREWLASRPPERVRACLDRIASTVTHMAPLIIYVGSRHYSNLGKFSNLPGKSLTRGAPGCLVTELEGLPAAQWRLEDAAFIVLLDTLLSSGPPVRAEEFNGTQLAPAELVAFLIERIAGYGEQPPERGDQPMGEWLGQLAGRCAEGRAKALASGRTPYRVINGITLHKREHLLSAPVTYADVPAEVRQVVEARTGELPERPGALGVVRDAMADLASRLVREAAPAGFSTAYEALLHDVYGAVAEALDADVAMGRGPRAFDALRRIRPEGADPLALGTGDFYCAVAPSAAFRQRFADEPATLTRCLSAYSSRMRFNTWHYLPHTLGITETDTRRDDWFFAPTMADVTDWSDQHHTGHVMFGVRHALRVPLGITFDERYLPGLYDLRVMRADGESFGVADLRSAIAVGSVLAMLQEALAGHDVVVRDFGNEWYRARYG
jgi:hypothetical protein